jgi:hypothetical protein
MQNSYGYSNRGRQGGKPKNTTATATATAKTATAKTATATATATAPLGEFATLSGWDFHLQSIVNH